MDNNQCVERILIDHEHLFWKNGESVHVQIRISVHDGPEYATGEGWREIGPYPIRGDHLENASAHLIHRMAVGSISKRRTLMSSSQSTQIPYVCFSNRFSA